MAYKHQSGFVKRKLRQLRSQLGFPVNTVRKWNRGRVIKTVKGWESYPEGGRQSVSTPTGAPPDDTGHWIDKVPGFPSKTTDQHFAGYKQPKTHRKLMHDRIIGKFFDHVKQPDPKAKPVAIMLMGGPASGKTTIASAYPQDEFVRLDADAIKEHVPEYKLAVKYRARNAAEMVHDESIHVMQELREKTIKSGKNLVMDGSGRHLGSYLRMIDDLHRAGYHVKVVMADVDKDTALKRAQKRAKKNGRWVPSHLFDASYQDVPNNFEGIAKKSDEFEMWNTRPESKPELVWEKHWKDGEKIHNESFVKNFKEKHGRISYSSPSVPSANQMLSKPSDPQPKTVEPAMPNKSGVKETVEELRRLLGEVKQPSVDTKQYRDAIQATVAKDAAAVQAAPDKFKEGEGVTAVQQDVMEGAHPVHTVRKWFGTVYQKREDGKWDKLGRSEPKRSSSRFKQVKQP